LKFINNVKMDVKMNNVNFDSSSSFIFDNLNLHAKPMDSSIKTLDEVIFSCL
jgi:hypothetical protein